MKTILWIALGFLAGALAYGWAWAHPGAALVVEIVTVLGLIQNQLRRWAYQMYGPHICMAHMTNLVSSGIIWAASGIEAAGHWALVGGPLLTFIAVMASPRGEPVRQLP